MPIIFSIWIAVVVLLFVFISCHDFIRWWRREEYAMFTDDYGWDDPSIFFMIMCWPFVLILIIIYAFMFGISQLFILARDKFNPAPNHHTERNHYDD